MPFLIRPTAKDFSRWSHSVPAKGDLVFFSRKPAGVFANGVVSSKKARRLDLWPLNSRSWYGYSLNRAAYCAYWPAGFIEKLSEGQREALAFEQRKIGVPTLIPLERVPPRLAAKLCAVGKWRWVTARAWSRLNTAERVTILKAWFKQNELIFLPSLRVASLPSAIRKRLRKLCLSNLLHTFQGSSGGNCFAAAAAQVRSRKELSSQWMNWPELKSHIERGGWKRLPGAAAEPWDLLLFEGKSGPVHAAIYLGEGIWFEKAGQDFYDPYRLVKFIHWKKEWPKTRLLLFRRRSIQN